MSKFYHDWDSNIKGEWQGVAEFQFCRIQLKPVVFGVTREGWTRSLFIQEFVEDIDNLKTARMWWLNLKIPEIKYHYSLEGQNGRDKTNKLVSFSFKSNEELVDYRGKVIKFTEASENKQKLSFKGKIWPGEIYPDANHLAIIN